MIGEEGGRERREGREERGRVGGGGGELVY